MLFFQFEMHGGIIHSFCSAAVAFLGGLRNTGGGGLGGADGRDVLLELVAGVLGVGDEGGEDVDEEGPARGREWRRGTGRNGWGTHDMARRTHSSPRRNSAVTARCSLERLDERTPP